MCRDKNKDEKYFKNYIENASKRIDKFENWIDIGKTPEARVPIVQKTIGGIKLRSIIAKYSLGDSLDDIKQDYLALLKGYNKYWPSGHVLAKSNGKELRQYLDYDDMLWMLSLGILFDASVKSFSTLADLIERDKVVDHLYEFLLSAKLDRIQKETESYEFGWDLYKSLREVITNDLSEETRIELLSKFLPKEWKSDHKEMLSALKGRHETYYGAWSFESAAVVSILNIDDSSFKDAQFYPSDLADFYKSHNEQSQVSDSQEYNFKLRKEKENYIITINFPDKERSFELLAEEVPEDHSKLAPLAEDIRNNPRLYEEREV